MSFLIDTNVISELRKGALANSGVRRWYDGVTADDLYLSTLVLGEIRKGAEMCRKKEPAKARLLEHWLGQVQAAFAGRIVPVDQAVAGVWGRIGASRTIPVIDALLAATAISRDLTLVTRDLKGASGTGARVLNPFTKHRP